jgi:outer membrane protein OmpA-like peptidoglycan-associated protein
MNRMHFERSSHLLVGLVAMLSCTVFVAACHVQEPGSPAVGLTKAVDPPELPGPGRGPSHADIRMHYNIWVGEVQEVCRGPSPYFDFDSAKTDAEDQPTMQALASCMLDGPLKGKSIRLIGHTDPRGTENYNEKLGLERAERVKRYLVSHRVDAARIVTETAGEDDASKAPASWPTDRRVEIRLVR